MTTEELLRETPVRGLQLLCKDGMYNPEYADYLGFGKVQDMGDGVATVIAHMDRALAPLELWGYITPTILTFRRLDMDKLFKAINPKVTLSPPFKVSDIFHQIEDAYGIQFDARDYVETTITSMAGRTVLIRAGDQSLRWHGHHMLTLTEVGE